MSDETNETTDETTAVVEEYVPILPDLDPQVMRETRLYELCLLLDPAEATRTWDKLTEFFSELLTEKYGGHVYRVDKWADSRRLAYEIKGLKRGTYMVIWFRCKPAMMSDLDREIRLDERSARHIIIHHEFEPPTVGMSLEDFEAGRADERREEASERPHRGGGGGGRY